MEAGLPRLPVRRGDLRIHGFLRFLRLLLLSERLLRRPRRRLTFLSGPIFLVGRFFRSLACWSVVKSLSVSLALVTVAVVFAALLLRNLSPIGLEICRRICLAFVAAGIPRVALLFRSLAFFGLEMCLFPGLGLFCSHDQLFFENVQFVLCQRQIAHGVAKWRMSVQSVPLQNIHIPYVQLLSLMVTRLRSSLFLIATPEPPGKSCFIRQSPQASQRMLPHYVRLDHHQYANVPMCTTSNPFCMKSSTFEGSSLSCSHCPILTWAPSAADADPMHNLGSSFPCGCSIQAAYTAYQMCSNFSPSSPLLMALS
jgi:hypothetical protein